MTRFARTAAASLVGLAFALPTAFAAVGDTLTYRFNASSTGGAVPTVNQATLLLTETAAGVNFRLTPNWGVTTGNRVDQLQFAYSGEAATFASLTAGSIGTAGFGFGAIDSGYNSTALVTVSWPPSGANIFDSSDPFSVFTLTGPTINLSDFQILATASSTKPSPAFGVISMPGAAPSNWVATGPGVVAAIPEPQTYALMGLGLVMMMFVARRRRND